MGWVITFFILSGLNLLCVLVNIFMRDWEHFWSNLTIALLFASVGITHYREITPQIYHFKEVSSYRVDTVTTIHSGDTTKTYNIILEDAILDKD